MRVISRSRIREFCKQYPEAANGFLAFVRTAETTTWRSIAELRRSYPHADAVIVASGKPVTVINIKGGAFRLIVAAHYNTGQVFILRFMRHAEYSRSNWKEKL
jgi:mRNA interferase HigB